MQITPLALVLVSFGCKEGECHYPEELGDVLAHSWDGQVKTSDISFLRFDKNMLVVGENEIVPEPAS
jgi:hypothetical protein